MWKPTSFEVTETFPYEISEMRNYDRNLVMAQSEDAKETPTKLGPFFYKRVGVHIWGGT